MASYTETVTDGANATQAVVDTLTMTEAPAVSANASDVLSTLLTVKLSDIAHAQLSATTLAQLHGYLLSSALSNDRLAAVLTELLASSADASDSLNVILRRFVQLRDIALAADAASTTAQLSGELLSLATSLDLLRMGHAGSLVSQAAGTDVLASRMRTLALLLSDADATTTAGSQLRITWYGESNADASDIMASSATLLAQLISGASASVVFRLGEEEYTAWVLNTESIAVTQYDNYPFNSFAAFNGDYYGATNDGIYLLDGDTDDGAPIKAYFRSGLMDFGAANLKRMPEVYLGYTASGDMVFKAVVVSPNGVKEEHWFKLEPRPAATIGGTRETAVPVGKGLKSVYWQYELHNVDGADFEIEAVRFWPMGLTRRVR